MRRKAEVTRQLEDHDMNQADQPPLEGRPRLPKKWLFLLIVLGFLAWASVGAMGLMPLWLWVALIAGLICTALLIALFAPRRIPR